MPQLFCACAFLSLFLTFIYNFLGVQVADYARHLTITAFVRGFCHKSWLHDHYVHVAYHCDRATSWWPRHAHSTGRVLAYARMFPMRAPAGRSPYDGPGSRKVQGQHVSRNCRPTAAASAGARCRGEDSSWVRSVSVNKHDGDVRQVENPGRDRAQNHV